VGLEVGPVSAPDIRVAQRMFKELKTDRVEISAELEVRFRGWKILLYHYVQGMWSSGGVV